MGAPLLFEGLHEADRARFPQLGPEAPLLLEKPPCAFSPECVQSSFRLPLTKTVLQLRGIEAQQKALVPQSTLLPLLLLPGLGTEQILAGHGDAFGLDGRRRGNSRRAQGRGAACSLGATGAADAVSRPRLVAVPALTGHGDRPHELQRCSCGRRGIYEALLAVARGVALSAAVDTTILLLLLLLLLLLVLGKSHDPSSN
mmetsp:Transcript_133017/g.284331  ORF Transcript_133017/g.284331 Transcript_133017/m.284331 type:complete len:200 (-) Transcript_133017:55-654(-)